MSSASRNIRITQVRSTIGRKEDQRGTLRALGLRGIGSSVVKPAEPTVLGMVEKVNYLVEVSEA